MNIKNLATATLALTMSASSLAAFELVNNGDFESGLDFFGTYNDGAASATHAASGGNPGGHGLSTGGGWGAGFVALSGFGPNGEELPISASDWGYAAGDTINITFDMIKSADATGLTGMKVESWANGSLIVGSDVQTAIEATTDWANYSHSYTLNSAADAFKVVLVGNVGTGTVGFDNLMIDNLNASAVPVPAAAWLFGSALAGLVAVRRKK